MCAFVHFCKLALNFECRLIQSKNCTLKIYLIAKFSSKIEYTVGSENFSILIYVASSRAGEGAMLCRQPGAMGYFQPADAELRM